ncbi:hypothetical protein ACFL6E_04900 [Candidatus Neomarinimicrobiota bacterium]
MRDDIRYEFTAAAFAPEQTPLDTTKLTIIMLLSHLTAPALWGLIIALVSIFGGGYWLGWRIAKLETPIASALSPGPVTEASPPLTSSAPGAEQTPDNLATREPLAIDVISSISPKFLEEHLRSLRSERGLRQLTALESGRPINETPFLTYFYIASSYLHFREGTDWSGLLLKATERYQPYPRTSYEVHYIDSKNIFLLGFISDSNLSEIGQLDGLSTKETAIYPIVAGHMNNLVSIPFSRLVSLENRAVEVNPDTMVRALDIGLQ